jgi:hypothetical protein
MPRSRLPIALVPAPPNRRSASYVTVSAIALLASLALAPSTAGAQGPASGTTLHLPANRFEFVASGDMQPPMKPLAVHNGGTATLTDVRLVRLSYADSARGAGWLVSLPRQSAVAPNELATIGTLCANAAGLPAGTYRATAAVGAREIAEPVAITITLVVTDAGSHASNVAHCGTAVTK